VVRSGTGTYTVDFPNGFVTGNAGNVQVTAHGMFVNNKQVGQHCKVVDWRKATNNNDLFVFVACHSADGTPSNSTFSVVWHRETFSGGPRGAYVWANKPTTASYTPSTSNQWNSTGGTNTITRASTGNYTVSLPGQASAGGNVQVTAFGSDASYCKTTGWSLGSNGKVNVGVRCFAASGSPVDSMFTLDFEYTPLTYFGIGGFLWADQPNSEDYVPNLAYSINTESDVVNEAGAIAFSSNSMIYGVTYDLLTIDDSVHMVTAYGLNADYCFTTLDLVQCNAPPGKTMNGDLYSDRMNSVLDF
jgi:hypothetical protein